MIVSVLVIMILLYALQISFTRLLAGRQHAPLHLIAEGAHPGSKMWQAVMSFPRNLKFWASALTIVFSPLGLTLIPSLPTLHLPPLITCGDPDLSTSLITCGGPVLSTTLYFANVALLTILITLEMGLFISIHRYIRPYWKELLVAALSLDVVTMYFYTVHIRPPSPIWPDNDIFLNVLMVLTFLSALISSLFVIISVRVVGLQDP